MKTKNEIRELARLKYLFPASGYINEQLEMENRSYAKRSGFIDGYTQAQEDMKLLQLAYEEVKAQNNKLQLTNNKLEGEKIFAINGLEHALHVAKKYDRGRYKANTDIAETALLKLKEK